MVSMKKLRGVGRAARKIGGGVVKGGKVAGAATRLTARLHNPVNLTKMAVNAVRGKGLVLPGSKYIGPGNSLNRGKAKSKADEAARRHDIDYDNYLKAGVSKKKLYTGFSDADQRLMKRSDVTTPDGLATYTGMLAKKGLHKIGLTGKRTKDPPNVAREINKERHSARRRRNVFTPK